ncbi:MAG: peptidoglycan DD-metalloendopeptidase family protein [Bacteroidetes bacterium]|nr:peptidoglycan DD-metalloendopeptidase family protein [Bacteroidota bacterium]
MVINNLQYTKHYYIENQRIISKLGGGFQLEPVSLFSMTYGLQRQNASEYLKKKHEDEGMVYRDINGCGYPDTLQFSSKLYSFLSGQPNLNGSEQAIYFYHSDHLGSTSYITDIAGYPYQHIDYLPFGAILSEERVQTGGTPPMTFYTPYKFNRKETDDESGLYYYGARYYDPKSSVWLGVDPLVDRFPFLSPFVYCLNNPIRLVDPNGMGPGDPIKDPNIRANRASNLFGFVRTPLGGSVPNSQVHQGFDYVAPTGTNILAVKSGTIYSIHCSDDNSYGLSITLQYQNDDGETRYAFYAHLSDINVSPGQPVSGTSGNAKGGDPHLHFENRSDPSPGKGLPGRTSPNDVIDTKFYSQNSDANQSVTGVLKVQTTVTGVTYTNQNRDGSIRSVNLTIVPSNLNE